MPLPARRLPFAEAVRRLRPPLCPPPRIVPRGATPAQRDAIIDTFHRASKPDEDLVADMQRFRELRDATARAYPAALRALLPEAAAPAARQP